MSNLRGTVVVARHRYLDEEVTITSDIGIMVILGIVVASMMCLMCGPRVLRRICCYVHQDDTATRARRFRDSLRHGGRATDGMSIEERRAYISSQLVIKHVVVTKTGSDEKEVKFHNIAISRQKSGIDEKETHACAICLNDYVEGDVICWSHNCHCNHAFHEECIVEWLIRHEDCPICRQNFLHGNDNEQSGTDDQSETIAWPSMYDYGGWVRAWHVHSPPPQQHNVQSAQQNDVEVPEDTNSDVNTGGSMEEGEHESEEVDESSGGRSDSVEA